MHGSQKMRCSSSGYDPTESPSGYELRSKAKIVSQNATMVTFPRRSSAFPVLLFFSSNAVEAFAPSRNLLIRPNGSCRAPTAGQQCSLLPRRMASGDDNEIERSMMDEMNFFKADIPPEIRSEIFEAEAKTQAGQDRAGRLANYATIVVVGLGIAVFNTFLTGLQDDGSTLAEAGFGWVEGNPLNSFLFTSKIGGAIALISAGLSAVMSEVELRGRRENVEKIWQEVQKRKQERERGGGSRKKKKGGGKKKKKLQKQAKRLSALSEVMAVDDGESNQQISPAKEAEVLAEKAPDSAADSGNDVEKKEEGGIVGKIKGFYERADSMAASQALLLNKELEDRGVVEKITDESGLNVIGREAAAKLEEEKQATKEKKDE